MRHNLHSYNVDLKICLILPPPPPLRSGKALIVALLLMTPLVTTTGQSYEEIWIGFEKMSHVGFEGETINLKVTKTGSGPATVRYATGKQPLWNGQPAMGEPSERYRATPGLDYTQVSGTLEFGSDDTEMTISINLLNDADSAESYDVWERFYVNLSIDPIGGGSWDDPDSFSDDDLHWQHGDAVQPRLRSPHYFATVSIRNRR